MMPRATPQYSTPEPRQVRFVRAVPPTPITFNQPLRGGRYRTIAGRLLGETRVDGKVHHYRVQDGNGVIFITPPEWLSPESVQAIDAAGMVVAAAAQNAKLDNITHQLTALAISLAARATKPEIVA